MMVTDQMILKAVLMLRKLGNKYQSKEAQIAEQKEWLKIVPGYTEAFEEWIDWMREELKKTPEQREAESREQIEAMEETEDWHEEFNRRDEWDDLWDDRAREVGARLF